MRKKLRNVTERFIHSMYHGGPITPEQKVDFGLDTTLHTYALYHSVMNGHIKPEQLDAALGRGAELTRLVGGDYSNPCRGIRFVTNWDILYGRGTQEQAPLEPDRTPDLEPDIEPEIDDD
ncbi:MAG: hypothetical protein QM770_01055 [Tepidisphaeraceae bacterium]